MRLANDRHGYPEQVECTPVERQQVGFIGNSITLHNVRHIRDGRIATVTRRTYTSKHQKMYNEATKNIRLAFANVTAGLLEGKSARNPVCMAQSPVSTGLLVADLPFSILGTYYVFKTSELGTDMSVMAMLSTVSSSVMVLLESALRWTYHFDFSYV